MERFELVSSALVADIIPVKKYRSKETGLNVCLVNIDGPIVNGYFCLCECILTLFCMGYLLTL